MLLFSATFKETVRAFAVQIVSSPIVIKLREEELTLSNIRQYFFVCRSREEKYRALCNIYGSITIGQAMIFCQVKRLSSSQHPQNPRADPQEGPNRGYLLIRIIFT